MLIEIWVEACELFYESINIKTIRLTDAVNSNRVNVSAHCVIDDVIVKQDGGKGGKRKLNPRTMRVIIKSDYEEMIVAMC